MRTSGIRRMATTDVGNRAKNMPAADGGTADVCALRQPINVHPRHIYSNGDVARRRGGHDGGGVKFIVWR